MLSDTVYEDFIKVLGKHAIIWDEPALQVYGGVGTNHLALSVTLTVGEDNFDLTSELHMDETPLVDPDTEYLDEVPDLEIHYPTRCHTLHLTYEGNGKFIWKRRTNEFVTLTPESIFEVIYYNDLISEIEIE